MAYGKNGLRALGLALLASLCLMAFVASAAQGHDWLLEGVAIGGKTPVGGEFDVNESLLVKGRNLRIKCEAFGLLNSELYPLPEDGVAHATILFEGCKAFELSLAGAELTKCHIVDGGGTALHITAKVKFLIALHANGERYILAEPLTAGQAFTVVKFLSGIGCALPLTTEVKGTLALRVDGGVEATQLSAKVHLLAPFPQTDITKDSEGLTQAALFGAGTGLTYGEFNSILHGSVNTFLTGADLNKNWGIS